MKLTKIIMTLGMITLNMAMDNNDFNKDQNKPLSDSYIEMETMNTERTNESGNINPNTNNQIPEITGENIHFLSPFVEFTMSMIQMFLFYLVDRFPLLRNPLY
jgi:hypothetical protein